MRVARTLRSLEGNDLVRKREAKTSAAPTAEPSKAAAAPAPAVTLPLKAATAGSQGAQEAYNKHKEEGNSHFKAGRLKEAVTSYGHCISLDPSSGAAFNNRSLCWLRLKEYARAEADATLVLHKEPGNVKAWFRRALARRAQDDLEGAMDDLNQALALDKTNAAALKERASLQEQLTAKGSAAANKPGKKGRRLVVEEVEDEEEEDEEGIRPQATATAAPSAAPDAASKGREKGSRPLVEELPSDVNLDGEAKVGGKRRWREVVKPCPAGWLGWEGEAWRRGRGIPRCSHAAFLC